MNRSCLDPTRSGRVSAASSQSFDIAIIGGGIVGMSAARDAAFRGYSVLLLEAEDYAYGTSSRSSKFLHGGIRYLEQGDFGLVREALLEREIICRAAPHICRAQRALLPVIPGISRPKWQIRIGMQLYDLLASSSFFHRSSGLFPAHQELEANGDEVKALRSFGLKFSGLFAYYDAQVDDTRLVIENMLDAEELGAVILNHAKVISVRESNNTLSLDWEDVLTGEFHSSSARYLINASGPWVTQVLETSASKPSSAPPLRYSRGSHLLFDVDLGLPGLTIPSGQRGRVYFVWPFFSAYRKATLVGTTEREVLANENNPVPSQDEIDELLSLLRRDLPAAGLSADRNYRTFAGMRILVAHGGRSFSTSAISRREKYLESNRVLHIFGGKYTTARHTAERAIDFADRWFGNQRLPATKEQLRARVFPGARGFAMGQLSHMQTELFAKIKQANPAAAVPQLQAVTSACLFRQGARALEFLAPAWAYKAINNFSCLAGEVHRAYSKEHAATLDDIILRRLVLWGFPVNLEAVYTEAQELCTEFGC